MTPGRIQKEFLGIFDGLGRHRSRHERFADFLELATCAIRKTTLPPGPEADALEARYMKVVAQYPPDDIRSMPELLALTGLAVAPGGCDFLGTIAGARELLDVRLGQLVTPYPVSRMMAEMVLQDAGAIIKERGFVTLQEPASGTGGMVIAAADILEAQGFNPGLTLYVEASDVAALCFKMTYLQLSLRGIPATVRQANSLSLEVFEGAHTPALAAFLFRHGDAFRRWREESRLAPPPPVGPEARQGDLFDSGEPKPPRRPRRRHSPSDPSP
jgi:hypothetical protein